MSEEIQEEEKQSWVGQLVGQLGPREAEAFPIGKMLKIGTKAARSIEKGVVSDTAKYLKGTEFMGQKVKNVTKGRGDWRYIILEDDTAYPVTKDVASGLVRTVGTAEKMTEFGAKKGQSQLDQAYKSLAYHEARFNPYQTRRAVEDTYRAYAKQMREANVEAIPYSLVERGGKAFTMPTPYAELLQKEGHLKIIRGLK